MTYDILLFIHMIALTMTVGTGFAMMALGRATADMEAADKTAFMLRAMALSKVGSIGFILLIISGLVMLFMRLESLMALGGPSLHAKFTFITIQIGLLGYVQMLSAKVKRAGGGELMAKLSKMTTVMFINSVVIVAAAVLAFH